MLGAMDRCFCLLGAAAKSNPVFSVHEVCDSNTRGHEMKLFKPRIISSIGQIIQQWNRLPQEVVMAKTVSSFKRFLDQYWTETGHGHCQRPSAY